MTTRACGAIFTSEEDARLFTAVGRYRDDQKIPGRRHAEFRRNPWTLAGLTRINVEEVCAAPGIVAVCVG